MAYFAQIDAHGTVIQVISISNAVAPDPAPINSEPLGQEFISDVLGLPGEWRQTSFNGSIRRRFAGIGWRYDSERDAFIEPKPFLSWTLDENHDWQPPIPMPQDGLYFWNEEDGNWEEIPMSPAE